MDEKIGNKLYELRKQQGYSQEELADILKVSRQAISKWECDDALPDTGNLIALSKLYGISLDELVNNEHPTATKGLVIDANNVNINVDGNSDNNQKQHHNKSVLEATLDACYPIIVAFAYVLWGTLTERGWAIGWTLFITIPVYYTFVECLHKKSGTLFAYPVLCAFVYCLVGMAWGIWHPTWAIFVSIPIYYAITNAIDNNKNK